MVNANNETDPPSRYSYSAGRHLYVLFAVHTRRCKIGSSSNPPKRLADIRNASADDVVLWCWAAEHGKYEYDLHSYFTEFRTHGEWFSPVVTRIVAREVEQFSASSERFAEVCRKWVGDSRLHRPPCPACGSRAQVDWDRIGDRYAGRCPRCDVSRQSQARFGRPK